MNNLKAPIWGLFLYFLTKMWYNMVSETSFLMEEKVFKFMTVAFVAVCMYATPVVAQQYTPEQMQQLGSALGNELLRMDQALRSQGKPGVLSNQGRTNLQSMGQPHRAIPQHIAQEWCVAQYYYQFSESKNQQDYAYQRVFAIQLAYPDISQRIQCSDDQ